MENGVLWIKCDKLPKIVLFYRPSKALRKEGHTLLGWKDVVRKD